MHPFVQKFINNELSAPMQATLIGGGFPLPTADLLYALSHAVFKELPLADAALETLKGMPESVVHGVVSGDIEIPEALGLVLLHRKEHALLEAALLNKALTAEWMEKVVPALPEILLEIVLTNQVLWIERPTILDALEAHPECSTNIKRRITEFRKDILGLLDLESATERIEILDDVDSGVLDKAWAELPVPKACAELEDDIAFSAKDGTPPETELITPIEATASRVEGKPIRSVAQRVMRLATNQKIILALKGGKEERTVLMREANRLIQVNVILNGRITEGEVAYIAQMRTVHEEVIRIISNNREWTRKYPILKNLVSNPRTPLPIAMNMLKRINEFDLKLMSKDRSVAETLRREAKRMIENKAAGRG